MRPWYAQSASSSCAHVARHRERGDISAGADAVFVPLVARISDDATDRHPRRALSTPDSMPGELTPPTRPTHRQGDRELGVWEAIYGLPLGGLVGLSMCVVHVYRRHKDSEDLRKALDKCPPEQVADVVRATAELRSAKPGRISSRPKGDDQSEATEVESAFRSLLRRFLPWI